ncbi:MAG TPA: SMI1/KNR4 family protein [Chloroflexia bacterium]|nr:SMI1/KNR4 family protein [Chloroflexia bacterium]
MQPLWREWPARWQAALHACTRKGGQSKPLVVDPPATEQEVVAVEAQLGFRIPVHFRTVLTQFSAHVDVQWSFSEELYNQVKDTALLSGGNPHLSLGQFCLGDCGWNLYDLLRLEKERQEWDMGIDDDEDLLAMFGVWREKLVFRGERNGDALGLGLATPHRAPVVYLAHDDFDDDYNGLHLGADFIEFIDRLSLLGCVGGDISGIGPFTNGHKATGRIEVDGAYAQAWRAWFGVQNLT